MAARRTRNTAPVEATEVQAPETVEVPEVIEEDAPVADDVVEVETNETDAPKARGRKADPLNAAITRVKESKNALELARRAVPLDQAQAEFDAAKADLEAQLADL